MLKTTPRCIPRVFPVRLHVYDLSHEDGLVGVLNSWGMKARLGGAFHAGLEVDGLEWSFGCAESGTGVYAVDPRKNPEYVFLETLDLGDAVMTRPELKARLRALSDAWPGHSYDRLHRNCCHFCSALASALGVRAPPAWLNRLANSADATVGKCKSIARSASRLLRTLSSARSRDMEAAASASCLAASEPDLMHRCQGSLDEASMLAMSATRQLTDGALHESLQSARHRHHDAPRPHAPHGHAAADGAAHAHAHVHGASRLCRVSSATHGSGDGAPARACASVPSGWLAGLPSCTTASCASTCGAGGGLCGAGGSVSGSVACFTEGGPGGAARTSRATSDVCSSELGGSESQAPCARCSRSSAANGDADVCGRPAGAARLPTPDGVVGGTEADPDIRATSFARMGVFVDAGGGTGADVGACATSFARMGVFCDPCGGDGRAMRGDVARSHGDS